MVESNKGDKARSGDDEQFCGIICGCCQRLGSVPRRTTTKHPRNKTAQQMKSRYDHRRLTPLYLAYTLCELDTSRWSSGEAIAQDSHLSGHIQRIHLVGPPKAYNARPHQCFVALIWVTSTPGRKASGSPHADRKSQDQSPARVLYARRKRAHLFTLTVSLVRYGVLDGRVKPTL